MTIHPAWGPVNSTRPFRASCDAIRFHPTLLELAAHYRFAPRPLAVARGNEKDDSECNYSVSRGKLNILLLSAAEREGAQILFDRRLTAFELAARRLTFDSRVVVAKRVIGTDGAASAVRAGLMRRPGAVEDIQMLGHGYKELEFPAAAGGGHAMAGSAFHLLPRGDLMLMGLPNPDGSFTGTDPDRADRSIGQLVEIRAGGSRGGVRSAGPAGKRRELPLGAVLGLQSKSESSWRLLTVKQNIRFLVLLVALLSMLGGTALAGGTKCRMSFELTSKAVFYKNGGGNGTITSRGGGITFGENKIVNGKGVFSAVDDIKELFGGYAQAEASAGEQKSASADAMWKGDVSLALSGTGEGISVGFSFGRFKIESN